jgi:hypothetical protein
MRIPLEAVRLLVALSCCDIRAGECELYTAEGMAQAEALVAAGLAKKFKRRRRTRLTYRSTLEGLEHAAEWANILGLDTGNGEIDESELEAWSMARMFEETSD